MKTEDFYQMVTDRILAEIEKGTPPWVKPWSSQAIPLPENPLTQKRYRGLNALWLDLCDMPYSRNQWSTFNQIKDAGGMVRKGEKGTHVLRPIEMKKAFTDAATGEDSEEHRTLFVPYVVFNLAQADGLDHLKPQPPEIRPVTFRADIDSAIKGTGGKIVPHDSHCFYRPADDTIRLVPPEQFESIDHFYATAFHELGHWTGHETRLARDLTGKFKTHAYAAEELIAELASSFACHHFGIDGLDRHAGAYLKNWALLFADDKKAILKAAGAAQRAFDHIVTVNRPEI